MGQAKSRGTFEDRQQQARARIEREGIAANQAEVDRVKFGQDLSARMLDAHRVVKLRRELMAQAMREVG